MTDQVYTPTVWDNGEDLTTPPTGNPSAPQITEDNLNKIENELQRLSQMRSAGEVLAISAGMEYKGCFGDTVELTSSNQVLRDSDDKLWSYNGPFPFDADGSTTPNTDDWTLLDLIVKPDVLPFSLIKADLHFGVLKGIPWNASESGGIVSTNSDSSASTGDMSLSVVSSTGFYSDQLICYMADDEQYYTAVIKSVVGNTLTLRTAIESDITAGGAVYNFYNNNAHPNLYGYYAITDYALREIKTDNRLVKRIEPEEFQVIGTASLTLESENSIYSPGSTNNEFLKVDADNNLDGVIVGEFDLPSGLYYIQGVINPCTSASGAASHRVQLSVTQTITTTGNSQTVAQQIFEGEDCTRKYGFYYYAAENSTQRINIYSRTSGGGVFEVGCVEIMRVENMVPNLNNGKHVLLGDSWFYIDGIEERLQERLPNATIFNEGVGGNKSDQLLSRFDSDVTPHEPNYVWVMCGTNDYFSDYTHDVFEYNMNALKQKIAEIGAVAIFFDPSVGEIDNASAPQNFDRSRFYALNGSYQQAEQQINAIDESITKTMSIYVNQTIAAGAEVAIFTPPNSTFEGFKVTESFFSGGTVASLTINTGYRGTVGVPVQGVTSYAANDAKNASDIHEVDAPDPGPRYICISAENTSGAEATCLGYITIEYSPFTG